MDCTDEALFLSEGSSSCCFKASYARSPVLHEFSQLASTVDDNRQGFHVANV